MPRAFAESGRSASWHRIAAASGVVAALVAASAWAATTPPPPAPSGARDRASLAAAERAFSATSVEQGMKPAFLANLAPDAIVFHPGPVNGVAQWEAHPTSKATLIWEPSFVETAAYGDLGLSTGPWELRNAGDTAVAFGHFVTMWKRDAPDAPWKVAIDLGISHDRPSQGGVGNATLREGPDHAPADYVFGHPNGMSVGFGIGGGGGGVGVGYGTGGGLSDQTQRERAMAHESNTMLSGERTYQWTMLNKGVAPTLTQLGAEDLRLYREGAPPVIGVMPAVEALKDRLPPKSLLTVGYRLSTSFDLGYSYGLITRTPPKQAKPDTSAYVHVWRRDPAGKWKLLLDIENDYPKR